MNQVLKEEDWSKMKWHTTEYGTEKIEGFDCVIELQVRPAYCDRGNYIATIHLKPGGDDLRLGLDNADGWPRYYMDLKRAKLECEAWLVKRKQSVGYIP